MHLEDGARDQTPAPPDIVATGTWLYDDTVKLRVHVVRLNYDFWYELGAADTYERGVVNNDDVAPGELPELNSEGCLYYVSFSDVPSSPIWPDSVGFKTVEEAKAAASTKIPGDIAWADPPR